MTIFSRFSRSVSAADIMADIEKAFAETCSWSCEANKELPAPSFTFHGPHDPQAEFPVPMAYAGYTKDEQVLAFWTHHKSSHGIAYALRPAADVLSRLSDKTLEAIHTVKLEGPRKVPLNVGIEAWPTVIFCAADIQELKLTAEAMVSANEIDGKRTELFSDVSRRYFTDDFVRLGVERQARSIVLQRKL